MGAIVHIVANKFPSIRQNLPKVAKAVAKFYIDTVYDLSQEYVPVDTGDLKESGHVVEMGSGYRLIYDAKNRSGIPYGGFVEYGTSRTPAQPFLNPAAEQALGMLERNLNLEELIAETI